MNNYNKNEKDKGGFWSALSGIFRGGSSAAGGASGLGSAGGFGSSGGLGGLFATKAGIVGMVLGGATLAAGVGVVYNFIGPSSKPAYSPDLFQNSYYEEESSKAGLERASGRDASSAASSTLDMFREQAKKDGLGGPAGEAAAGAATDAVANAPAGGPQADSAAPGASGMDGAASAAAPKLQAASGFGGGKGGAGGGTSAPRMQSGGGLSGGIGSQFASVYRAPAQANAGKTSGMSASAARVNGSPKYAVRSFNKKGAFGQAKYAGNLGAKAAYSADGAGARTSATNAFSGETSGAGDVGTPTTGSGLGGAGVTSGANLKGSDPSLNSNESTPPKVPDAEAVNPWQKYEDMAMSGMMKAFGCLLLTMALGHFAKAWPPLLYAALAVAAIGAVFALKVIMAGMTLMNTYGQKMMGGVYVFTGIMLIIQLWNAACGAAANATAADGTGATDASKAFGGDSGNGWAKDLSGMKIGPLFGN